MPCFSARKITNSIFRLPLSTHLNRVRTSRRTKIKVNKNYLSLDIDWRNVPNEIYVNCEYKQTEPRIHPPSVDKKKTLLTKQTELFTNWWLSKICCCIDRNDQKTPQGSGRLSFLFRLVDLVSCRQKKAGKSLRGAFVSLSRSNTPLFLSLFLSFILYSLCFRKKKNSWTSCLS